MKIILLTIWLNLAIKRSIRTSLFSDLDFLDKIIRLIIFEEFRNYATIIFEMPIFKCSLLKGAICLQKIDFRLENLDL